MAPTVGPVVFQQLQRKGQQSSSVEIVIQIQQEAGRTALTGTADWDPPEPAPAADALNPVVADPLAIQPVVAPAAVRARQPFRRHIEGSRPYLVLGEGVRMINAHPVAHMVFWGGGISWLLGSILEGHHVAGAVRAVVLLAILAGWLASCLHRTGRLGLARDSLQAIRMVLAEPATWTRIAQQGRTAWLAGGLARCIAFLLRARVPARALLGTGWHPGGAPADSGPAASLAEYVDEDVLAVPRVGCGGER
jgi:hypothetical protein